MRELASPVTLTVNKGLVARIEGKEPFAERLRERFAEREENRNIAEIGIGTNDRAKRPDNILESEKILGTVHVALGDNSSFGGTVKTPFHQDFVFFRPTVTLVLRDGSRERLLRDGSLVIRESATGGK
jgi:leucyl aminopeptidase (aminopeptidase T)